MPQALPTTHLSTLNKLKVPFTKRTNRPTIAGKLIARKTQSLSSTINIRQITSDDDLQVRAATGLFPKIKDCNRIDFNAPANTSLEQCLRFRLTSTWVYLPFACSEKVPKSLGGFIVIRYDYDWKRIIRETLCGCDDSAAAANMTLRQAGNPSPLSWTLRLAGRGALLIEGAKISNKQKMVGGICGFADSTQTLDSNVASCGQGQPTRLMKWAACNSRSRSQWNSLCILHNQSPTASCGGQTGIDSLE